MDTDNNIKVAIRIRPQVPKEVIDMCSVCTDVTPNEPQVWLGKDKAFTFDHVFDLQSRQEQVYNDCCHQLIEGCFEGYNATILAYGQTGSGKTYTMGTGLDIGGNQSGETGIIPRAVDHLFEGIKRRQEEAKSRGLPPPEFQINAQFLELYNEEVIDLLSEEKTKHSAIKIREDADGGMYLMGATTRPVSSVDDCLYWLKQGALSRTTGATQMNAQSSRSHAIFTLHVKQLRVVPMEDEEVMEIAIDDKENTASGNNGTVAPLKTECETLTAKFHFVDLAGSERLKRTGATGDRQKEGISINSGLLSLGNVISALGDTSKRSNHVPYRDSKLTRLLQDSLGGNSRTLMIACVSPSDRDFMETLNTLRYANRAKNIKNRVVANQDKSSQTINALRRQIQQLTFELMEYKQGKKLVTEDGTERTNDMYHENNLLQTEILNLKTRVKALQDTNQRLTEKNTLLLAEKETGNWLTGSDSTSAGGGNIGEIIHKYLTEIEDLRTKLIEAEETCSQLRKQVAVRSRMTMSPHAIAMSGHYEVGEQEAGTDVILSEAKREVAMQKKLFSAKKHLFKSEKDSQDANGNETTLQNGRSSSQPVMMNGDGGKPERAEGDEDAYEEIEVEEEIEEDEDEEEEDDDNDDNVSQMDQELLELTNEITTKEKLIAELEKNQRKLRKIKQDYEDKLAQLQVQIKSIEAERDTILAKLSSSGSKKDGEKAKKVRDEFQNKINALQKELKVMEEMRREHTKKMREQTRYEQESKKLKNELADMKRAKVRLVTQMRDENAKHREAELKLNKKIAQVSKQDRIKDGKIRTLETEKNRMQFLLKRKEEENNALKKQTIKSSMSDRVAGRVPRKNQINKSVHSNVTFNSRTSSVGQIVQSINNGQLAIGQVPSFGYHQVVGHSSVGQMLPPPSPMKTFSPKKAKNDWNKLEQTINKLVLSRQTISKHEEQMERELKSRERLTKQKSKLEKDLERSRRERKPMDVIRTIQEEIESIEANIGYLSSNITECQQIIVQLEENKEEFEDLRMSDLVMNAPREEVKYLFDKLIALTTNQAMLAARAEEEKKDYEMRLQQKAEDSMVQEQLFHHLLEQTIMSPTGLEVSNSKDDVNGHERASMHDTTFLAAAETGFTGLPPGFTNSNEVLNSIGGHNSMHDRLFNGISDSVDMRSQSPAGIMSAPTPEMPRRLNIRPSQTLAVVTDNLLDPSNQYSPQTRREKARRMTKTTAELLFESSVSDALPSIPNYPLVDHEAMTRSLPPGSSIDRIPSIPSLKCETAPRTNVSSRHFEPSPSLARRHADRTIAESRRLNKTSTNLSSAATSPVHVPSGIPMSASNHTISTSLHSSSSSGNSANQQQPLVHNHFSLNLDLPDTTPPASPSMLRRNRDENVFSRLTSGTTSAGIGNPDRGVIAPFTAKAHYDKHSPLICTHVAEGHSRSVLSVCATNDVMFTGSKDNTVKIWDLHTGQEMQSLVDHPDSVSVVRYNEFSRLAFSVSKSYIKVWDPRDSPARCIKTLNSSGLLTTMTAGSMSKGNELPHGETRIFDIQLSLYGTTLFSTCGHIVRSWDLRMFMCLGKLNTGHQANIICMAVEEAGIETNTVVTGSKDHYIKMFEVMEGIGGIQNPKATLTPPHYDGIEALKIHNDYLYSASRDACIKKWDLSEQRLLHSVNSAHKDWIQSLAILPNTNTLISGCRQGYLKLWSTERLESVTRSRESHHDRDRHQVTLINDIRAHSGAINCIDTNANLVFTASGDTTVALWRNRSSGEPSPDISE